MRLARVLLCFLLLLGQQQLIEPASALGSQNVVIKQLYPGATGIAAQEFVELYNNSSVPVDVTGWCLYYKSANGGLDATGWTKLGCLTAPDSSTKLWVKAGGHVTFASNEYKIATSALSDVAFTGGMNAAGGHLRLTDGANAEVDRIGWGTANNPEGTVTPAPSNTKSLQRKAAATQFQDTDNNNADFEQVVPLLHASDVYEVVTQIDVCPNIPDTQPTMPVGYLADQNGHCQADSCLNIAGLQVSVPENFIADTAGYCIEIDECVNLEGKQHQIPEGMVRGSSSDCIIEYSPLQLTEIMPNAIGSDTGNEFIEIYNPTNQTIDLTLYAVKIGDSTVKSFPIGAMIAPGEYRTFSDSLMKFTLVNTSGRVVLTAIGDVEFSDTGVYDSAPDGQSWALIDGTWQYTNRPTPSAPNLVSLVEEVSVDSTDVANPAPCPSGKYRNPLTNRCRNIESDASVLAACDTDQYRNPETGRCKKISVSSLAPCKDNQYRSEETNRCRNIVSASSAKPCKDNQYRSEETGRCRNIQATGIPEAAFAVQPVKETGMAFVGWWAVGGVGLLAMGYAVWEWRREIRDYLGKFVRR